LIWSDSPQRSIEKAIKSGKSLPPLTLKKTGVLKNGHHRLQAYRNVRATAVPVEHEK
jgi:hypothetical protein